MVRFFFQDRHSQERPHGGTRLLLLGQGQRRETGRQIGGFLDLCDPWAFLPGRLPEHQRDFGRPPALAPPIHGFVSKDAPAWTAHPPDSSPSSIK